METITFELQGTAPQWAKNARWYYENASGEQWIATVENGNVIISGFDIGWREMRFNLQQSKEAYQVILGTKDVDDHFMNNPLAEWILDAGESLWVASVLLAAIDMIKMEKLKAEQIK